MVLRNTTLVPSLGSRIAAACEAGLSAGMQRKRVPPQKKKEIKDREFKPSTDVFIFPTTPISCTSLPWEIVEA